MNAEQMRWAIGPRADYYLRQFEKFEDAGKSTLPTWNWTAFFFSTPWFTYRRLDGYATANFFLPIVFLVLLMFVASPHDGGFLAWFIGGAYLAIAFVLVPMYANGIYYRRLKAQFARATVAGADAEKEWPRPPSAWKLFSAVFTGALALVVPYFLAVAPAAYESYAPRARMIVVTMGDSSSSIAGKRFAMHAREERGVLEWACRTIHLDRKYLPAACRD